MLRTCETTGLEQADHRHATMTSVKKAERTCTECGRDQKKKAAYNKRKSEYLVNKLREDHVMRIGKSTSFLLGEPEEPVGDGSEGFAVLGCKSVEEMETSQRGILEGEGGMVPPGVEGRWEKEAAVGRTGRYTRTRKTR